jgi:pyruvate dehydrogenase E1 component alpha subunit
MHDAAWRATDDLRQGLVPRFLEIKTARWRDHVGPGEDREYGYRSEDELNRAIAGDPLADLAEKLGADARRDIGEAVEAEIAAAIAFAEDSPFPDDKEVFDHVFAARE